uniref:SH2 domain-containing protein n=1 Tax=Heterorhabditis bacteriophora TaxID=37862 RepID=A0A1I7X2B3_HETBA
MPFKDSLNGHYFFSSASIVNGYSKEMFPYAQISWCAIWQPLEPEFLGCVMEKRARDRAGNLIIRESGADCFGRTASKLTSGRHGQQPLTRRVGIQYVETPNPKDNFTFKCHRSTELVNGYQEIYGVSCIPY